MTRHATLHPFSLPLASPLVTSQGVIEDREGFLVRIEDVDSGDGGAVGWGEATPLPGWTETLEECHDALERAVERLAGDGAAAALAACADAPAARHAVELAHLDGSARRAGEPLYRHIGGAAPVGSVPVNATVGDGSVAETVEAAETAVDSGFECIKVKVGARGLDEDVARIAAARETVGPGVELRADANGAWTREEAARALDGLADAGVSYVEQPLEPGDLAGHRELRGGPVGIALDEALVREPVERVLDADAADVLILKPMALGGIRRAREAALAAADAGVEPVVTTTVDAVVARGAAVHLAASLGLEWACGLATADRLAVDLGTDPAPVRQGAATVPQRAGLGVAPEVSA